MTALRADTIAVFAEQTDSITEGEIKRILRKIGAMNSEEDYAGILTGNLDPSSNSKTAKIEAILREFQGKTIQLEFMTQMLNANLNLDLDVKEINKALFKEGLRYDRNDEAIVLLGPSVPGVSIVKETSELEALLTQHNMGKVWRLFEQALNDAGKSLQLALLNGRNGYQHLVSEVIKQFGEKPHPKNMAQNIDTATRLLGLSDNIKLILKGVYGEVSDPVHGNNLERLDPERAAFLWHMVIESSLLILRSLP